MNSSACKTRPGYVGWPPLALLLFTILTATLPGQLSATVVLLEAEAFSDKGGWLVDPQFVEQMGSPFLMAHGGGKRVADARTTVPFPEPGEYRVWVRTRDWVPTHPDNPGRFKLLFDGAELPTTFGIHSGSWGWEDGGTVQISSASAVVSLRDLTGFDGRCDAIAFIKGSNEPPPPGSQALTFWRLQQTGEVQAPANEHFDCVIVGGGMAGCCASLSGARSGLSVALVHDRPVVGGNASQEIRVATRGEIRNSIVDELDTFYLENRGSGTVAADTNRLRVLQAETNLTLFLQWRAYAVGTNEIGRITHVDARHTLTGERRRLSATTFIDCTGDGWIGYWAGAAFRMGREAAAEFGETRAPVVADAMTMGNSLMWTTATSNQPVAFPEVPMSMGWALQVAGTNAATGGDWNWEYGMHLDTIKDAEEIRDHLLRAIYGNFYNAKQKAVNANLGFAFLPYIAGKRESRRFIGDHILTQSDITTGAYFEDAVGTATWGIDLHYPTSTSYLSTYTATSVSRWYYPFRSLYSCNVPNLMMAGRCISISHVGLGSPRVQNTTAQMGVAVGYAAALCKKYGIDPRDIYRSVNHTLELQAKIGGSWPEVPRAGGIIVDNADPAVAVVGAWTSSVYDSGYIGTNYLHDANTGKGLKSVSFKPPLPEAGSWEVFARWTSSGNRATNAPISILCSTGSVPVTVLVNQQTDGGRWVSIGIYHLSPATAQVVIANSNTTGHVIVDAVRFVDVTAPVQQVDRDEDGLPDWWERWYFLSETGGAANVDVDQDGRTNLQEYLTGTDPLNDKSRFDLRLQLDAMPHQALLKWPSTTNRTYRIEVSDDLKAFRVYARGIPANPPENKATVLAPGEKQYFRVVAE